MEFISKYKDQQVKIEEEEEDSDKEEDELDVQIRLLDQDMEKHQLEIEAIEKEKQRLGKMVARCDELEASEREKMQTEMKMKLITIEESFNVAHETAK